MDITQIIAQRDIQNQLLAAGVTPSGIRAGGGLAINPAVDTSVISQEDELKAMLLNARVQQQLEERALAVAKNKQFIAESEAAGRAKYEAANKSDKTYAPKERGTGTSTTPKTQDAAPMQGVNPLEETLKSILANAPTVGADVLKKPLASSPKSDYVDAFNAKSAAGEFDASEENIAMGASPNRVQASLQPNGVVSFTNRNTPVQPLPISGVSPSELATADSINKSILNLQGKSPLEIAQGMEAIKSSGLATIQGMESAALSKARTLAGIPALEASLIKAQAQDRTLAAQGVPASELPHAKSVLIAIENANKIATNIADRELGGNITYASIKSKIAGLDKNPVLGVIGQESSYADTLKRADLEKYNALPTNVQANYARIYADKKGDITGMLAASKMLPKEEQEALTQGKEKLLLNAVANPDNGTAVSLVTKLLEEDNIPPEAAKARLKEMHSLMNNPKEFAKISKGLFTPQDIIDSTTGSKEQREQIKEKKAQIVIQYMDNTATSLFMQNPTEALSAFAILDPDLKTAIDKAPTKDLGTIAQLYIGDDYATGMAKSKAFRSYLAKISESRKKTLVGNVDFGRMMDELPTIRKQSRVAEFFSDIGSSTTDVSSVVADATTPVGLRKKVGEFISDEWDFFFNPNMNE